MGQWWFCSRFNSYTQVTIKIICVVTQNSKLFIKKNILLNNNVVPFNFFTSLPPIKFKKTQEDVISAQQNVSFNTISHVTYHFSYFIVCALWKLLGWWIHLLGGNFAPLYFVFTTNHSWIFVAEIVRVKNWGGVPTKDLFDWSQNMSHSSLYPDVLKIKQ